MQLIAQMHELGRIGPKQIAALAGLAPLNVDSGTYRGRRTIGGGRKRVRDALYMAAVQTLVVADGVRVAGSECPVCGRLVPGRVATCPACGASMRAVHELVHRAMERAREQAGRVEVVHGAAARRLLEAGGGLGALLRYR